jgi:tRNA (uracil-5-)-methyltransferase TRM9
VGLDSGTGNGKYLPLPVDYPGKILTVGLDRSQNLLNIARTAGGNGEIREVVRGDVLERGWRRGAFVRMRRPNFGGSYTNGFDTLPKDYAISIATIHHLTTFERRVTAIKVCSMEYHSCRFTDGDDSRDYSSLSPRDTAAF